MRIVASISSILLVLLLFSPIVLADEFSHTLGGRVAPSIESDEVTPWIENEINSWKVSTVNQLSEVAPHLEIVLDDFQFDVMTSVNEFVDRTNIPWYAFWRNKQEVHQPLDVTLSQRLLDALDADPALDMVQTSADLQLKASVLSNEPIQLIASNVSVSDMERVGFVNVQTGLPAAELNAVVELLNDKVLQSQETFSLIDTLRQGSTPITEDTANFTASMLYISVLQTELAIVERHSLGYVPSYTTLGLEAMVSDKLSRDFQFQNTFDTPLTINVSSSGGVFLLELYTLNPDSSASYEVGSREEVQPKRVNRYVGDLVPGAERRIESGVSGWRVTTFRTVSSRTGSFETQEVIARDYYPPQHEVYEISALTLPPAEEVVPGEPATNPDGTPATPVDPNSPNGDGTTADSDSSGNGENTGDGSGTGSSGGTTGDSSGNGSDSTTDNGSGNGSNGGYDKGGNKID